MSVRVRIAPSPTGPLHVGTARTALFNYLFAKQQGGTFIFRVEDTDAARSKPEYEQEIIEGLKWLGLSWDEGPDVGGPNAPYRQSERSAYYNTAIEKLLREGKAHEGDGVVTFRVTEETPLVVHDLIRGDVKFPVTELTDFIIAKSTDRAGEYLPLYHLAVVADDAAMDITHVIRGEDHLSNTPKHILLQRALGLPMPQYGHVPLLLDAERKKLSKRTLASGVTLDTRLLFYRDRGYLPEAMANFLALLGWNPKTEDEVFTMEQLIERFRLEGIQKGGAVFDVKKLEWLQRQHLQNVSVSDLVPQIASHLEHAGVEVMDAERLTRALGIWRERGGPLAGAPEAIRFYFAEPVLDASSIPWKETSRADALDALRWIQEQLQNFDEVTWMTRGNLQDALIKCVDGAGRDRGTTLWPMRYALSGLPQSPGPGEIAWVLGEEETLRRIQKAVQLLA